MIAKLMSDRPERRTNVFSTANAPLKELPDILPPWTGEAS